MRLDHPRTWGGRQSFILRPSIEKFSALFDEFTVFTSEYKPNSQQLLYAHLKSALAAPLYANKLDEILSDIDRHVL